MHIAISRGSQDTYTPTCAGAYLCAWPTKQGSAWLDDMDVLDDTATAGGAAAELEGHGDAALQLCPSYMCLLETGNMHILS